MTQVLPKPYGQFGVPVFAGAAQVPYRVMSYSAFDMVPRENLVSSQLASISNSARRELLHSDDLTQPFSNLLFTIVIVLVSGENEVARLTGTAIGITLVLGLFLKIGYSGAFLTLARFVMLPLRFVEAAWARRISFCAAPFLGAYFATISLQFGLLDGEL